MNLPYPITVWYMHCDPRHSSFRGKCQHVHEEHCTECDDLTSVLDEINKFVKQASFPSKDDRDEALYLAQHSKDMIQAWRRTSSVQ